MAWHKCVVRKTSDGWVVKDGGAPPVKVSARTSAIAAAIRIALNDAEADGCVRVTFQSKNDGPDDR